MAQGETDRSANVVLIAGPITGHPKEPLSCDPPASLAEGAMLRDGASWKPLAGLRMNRTDWPEA